MQSKISLSLLLAAALLAGCSQGTTVSRSALVNTLVGTDFTGNTYPGAQAPFGMVQLSPDNGTGGWDRIPGYYYPDSTIAGFSHTHLDGTGAGDLYDILFMPYAGKRRVAEGELGLHSHFSHESETAEAGYYRVSLGDYNVGVELTATERCGIQRYTFPRGGGHVVLNLVKHLNWDATVATHVEAVDSQTLRGYRYSDGWARGQRVYFCTRFSRPWTKSGNVAAELGYGEGDVWQYDFPSRQASTLTVTTALSPTSMEAAAANLAAEAPDDDFDRYRQQAQRTWDEALSVIDVEAGEGQADEMRTFYTALYHSMLCPTIYSDVAGTFRGADGKTRHAKGWTNYETFSLWDTYRAAHPLLTLTQPRRVGDMVRSLVDFYAQNGRLPVWNMWASETDMMIGYHAAAVIADAYLKGFKGFDPEQALEACVQTARKDEYRGIGFYRQHGWVPYDLKDPYNDSDWSLSKTLEYAYDDYCIARMAQKMGRKDIADEFFSRAQNYRNVYNPRTGWMQPRDSKGEFQPGFCPDDYTAHICESNGWQYFWSVQHDVEGLMRLMGGRERMAERLDSMFSYTPKDTAGLPLFSTGMIGQYAHGNEPSHHVIYLYNKVGQPHKTQRLAARVMRTLYRNTPDGLCGNEDCGQTSAWYVWSAMGLYPVDPVSGQYEIGSPLFSRIRLRTPSGKWFTVEAPGVSETNIYVRRALLNGRPLDRTYITHEEILSGATLTLEMGAGEK